MEMAADDEWEGVEGLLVVAVVLGRAEDWEISVGSFTAGPCGYEY